MDNKKSLTNRARNAANTAKFHAVTGGAALGGLPMLALAQDSDFDASEVTATIASNGAIAVGIVGALILAAWGIRSMGLLRGRG